jgi:hypothetical protein
MRIPESDQTVMRWVVQRYESVQNIIDGLVFYAYSSKGDGNNLANDASIDIVVTSPVNMPLGIGFVARVGGDSEFKVFENVTNVVGGTIFVPKNRNRASSKISQTGVIIQPTSVTTNGVLYEEIIIGGSSSGGGGNGGGGGGNRTAAGATLDGDYAIIKANTSYLFRLTNRSNQSQLAELFVQWVENG